MLGNHCCRLTDARLSEQHEARQSGNLAERPEVWVRRIPDRLAFWVSQEPLIRKVDLAIARCPKALPGISGHWREEASARERSGWKRINSGSRISCHEEQW